MNFQTSAATDSFRQISYVPAGTRTDPFLFMTSESEPRPHRKHKSYVEKLLRKMGR